MRQGICPWEALDSERFFEGQQKKRQQKIQTQLKKSQKIRPATANPTIGHSLSCHRIVENKKKKYNARKDSAKIELEQQFVKLASEQLPLGNTVASEFNIPIGKIHLSVNSSSNAMLSSNKGFQHYENKKTKQHRRIYSPYKSQTMSSKKFKEGPKIFQTREMPSKSAQNYVHCRIQSDKFKSGQPIDNQILLNVKLSSLIKKVRKSQSKQYPVSFHQNTGNSVKFRSVGDQKFGFFCYNSQIQ